MKARRAKTVKAYRRAQEGYEPTVKFTKSATKGMLIVCGTIVAVGFAAPVVAFVKTKAILGAAAGGTVAGASVARASVAVRRSVLPPSVNVPKLTSKDDRLSSFWIRGR